MLTPLSSTAPPPEAGPRHAPEALGIHDAPAVSQQWFDRAKKVLAGGISSSARSTSTGPWDCPLYIVSGKGSRVTDADGNSYVDYLLSYGSAVLGHADAGLLAAVEAQLHQGTMFGTCNTAEVELAEEICRQVPCAQLVRFANSGSEAICGAVRAARGYTGRNKIIKFEGHYHGWVDVLAVSNRPSAADCGSLDHPNSHAHSRGMPAGVVNDVVIAPWNQPELLRGILDAHAGEVAAIIAEPIVANNACIMPQEGYLQFLREICDERQIVLIFDEIVTGFRLGPGGAQEMFNVTPDLAVYSKAIGGGFPISAFAGRRALMEPVAANTVKHGGTYNGNPLCATAALHTLRSLRKTGAYASMRREGEAVMHAIRRSSHDLGVPCVVQGAGSMFQVVFTDLGRPLRHYRDLLQADFSRFAAFRQALLQQGILANTGGTACWFVSSAHGPADTALAVDAVAKALQAVR